MAKFNVPASHTGHKAADFLIGGLVVLVSLCGYAALYTVIVMHSFNVPGMIMFVNQSIVSHLLPFIGGALLTLLLAAIIIKYLINPQIKTKYHPGGQEIAPHSPHKATIKSPAQPAPSNKPVDINDMFARSTESKIINFLYQASYPSYMHATQAKKIWSAIGHEKETKKAGRLALTAMLTGYAPEIAQDSLDSPSLHPYKQLVKPIHYRIKIQKEWACFDPTVTDIMAVIAAIYYMEKKQMLQKATDDAVQFAIDTLPTFFANLLNASRRRSQIEKIGKMIAHYIKNYFPEQQRDRTTRSKFIIAILSRVDFLSWAQCASPDKKTNMLAAYIALAKDNALTPTQLRTCLLRPALNGEKRDNGECLLDITVIDENKDQIVLSHIIATILTPLADYENLAYPTQLTYLEHLTLISDLLEESNVLVVLLPQEGDIFPFNRQKVFKSLLQYSIDCLKEMPSVTDKAIKKATAWLGKSFLHTLQVKIKQSDSLDENKKLIMWAQYLQCITEKVALLGINYDRKARYIETLYNSVPTFRQGEESYQRVLEKQQCCITLSRMLRQQNPNNSQHLEQVFKQAATGTLYDIYQVLTTYWDCLCQPNQETQTTQIQWLCVLLGADEDTLPQCLSQWLSQSYDKNLKSKLLGLLFKGEKQGAGIDLEAKQLDTKTIKALLMGKNNIYTPPPMQDRPWYLMRYATIDFNAVWDNTQPWLSQQTLEIQKQVLGKKLLGSWLAWVIKSYYHHNNPLFEILARVFSNKQKKAVLDFLLTSNASTFKAIFCYTGSLDHRPTLLLSIPLLNHLLPLVMESHTHDKTSPKWLAPNYLVAWLQALPQDCYRTYTRSWRTLITTMAQCCPSLLLSQLTVKNKVLLNNEDKNVIQFAIDNIRNDDDFFKPVVMTLWQLSAQHNIYNTDTDTKEKARALLMQPDTMGVLYHLLLQEANCLNHSATWTAFMKPHPADCLFEAKSVIRLPDPVRKYYHAIYHDNCPSEEYAQLITILNATFFAEETPSQQHKAACFLANLSQFMPNNLESAKKAVTTLFNHLVKQLKKINKRHLAALIFNKFTEKLQRQVQPDEYQHFIEAAITYQKTYTSTPLCNTGQLGKRASSQLMGQHASPLPLEHAAYHESKRCYIPPIDCML